mgnify:CR=1 FL=1
MLQPAQEGEVGESRDRVVGKVDRVELVACYSKVLDSSDLVPWGREGGEEGRWSRSGERWRVEVEGGAEGGARDAMEGGSSGMVSELLRDWYTSYVPRRSSSLSLSGFKCEACLASSSASRRTIPVARYDGGGLEEEEGKGVGRGEREGTSEA